MVEPVIIVVSIIAAILLILLLSASIRVIQPYEQALYILLGKFKRKLNTGVNLVVPLGSRVIRLDMRTEVLDVPRQEVITKDNSPTNVDAIIYTKVVDPVRATFEVADYKFATIALAQTTLRSVIGDMELDEVLNSREAINTRLRDTLDQSTDAWGVKVEGVEIREVDPVERVKRAMEEQTSAERERRAAILKADGAKRAAVLEAEGLKRARILQAEGKRQSQILEAEGERTAQILTSQGRAQALRVLALGAVALDNRALSVLSLDALAKLGQGQATKIILPFEVTKAMQGIAQWLGTAPDTPPGKRTDLKELEAMVGTASDVLGDIPKHAALKAELDQLASSLEAEQAMDQEMAEARGPVGGKKKGKAAASAATRAE